MMRKKNTNNKIDLNYITLMSIYEPLRTILMHDFEEYVTGH